MTEQLDFEFFEVESKQEQAEQATRVCTSCGVRHPLTEEFWHLRSNGTDHKVYLRTCAACRRKAINHLYNLRKDNVLPEDKEHCDCCGKHYTEWFEDHHVRGRRNRGFHLDHNHITNEFRGWLCPNCNKGIGMLGDDLRGVLMAVEYLKRSNEKD